MLFREQWTADGNSALTPLESQRLGGSRGNGGQGWIRTSVRLRGQIYSLLPLTTRPPVHGLAYGAGNLALSGRFRREERPFGEGPLACQWWCWQGRNHGQG
jgi:hypothetical protein